LVNLGPDRLEGNLLKLVRLGAALGLSIAELCEAKRGELIVADWHATKIRGLPSAGQRKLKSC
jgi:hypothetical protein